MFTAGCSSMKGGRTVVYNDPAGRAEVMGPDEIGGRDGYARDGRRGRVPEQPERGEYEIVDPVQPEREGYGVVHPIQPERPVMMFNSTESANVRIPLALNNPFPPTGNMEISLDGLAEEFYYPYQGEFLSPFGMRGRSMHTGVDIRAIPNDTVRAAWPGVVRMAQDYSGYGNIVVIRHYNGMETAYAHHSRNLVKVNDVVESGAPIGLAGRTGTATTEHLHFEVRVGSEPLDPALFIDPQARTLRRGTVYVYNRGGTILAYNEDKSSEVDAIVAAQKSAVPEAVAVSAPAAAVAAAVADQAVYYNVKSGDTLSAIARTYSTTVDKLCQLNNIKSTGILQINQRLRVK